MHRSSAVGTSLLEQFAAYSAILAANRIRRLAVRPKEPNFFHKVLVVRRAVGIWTKTPRKDRRTKVRQGRRIVSRVLLCRLVVQVEFLRKLVNDLVVKLGTIPLLKHRKRGLLATDLGSKLSLREPSLTSGGFHAFTEFYVQVFHNANIMDFIL